MDVVTGIELWLGIGLRLGLGLALGIRLRLGMGLEDGITNKLQLNYQVSCCDICNPLFTVVLICIL